MTVKTAEAQKGHSSDASHLRETRSPQILAGIKFRVSPGVRNQACSQLARLLLSDTFGDRISGFHPQEKEEQT